MHVTLHKRKAKPLKTNTDSTKVQTFVSIRSKYTFINPKTFSLRKHNNTSLILEEPITPILSDALKKLAHKTVTI